MPVHLDQHEAMGKCKLNRLSFVCKYEVCGVSVVYIQKTCKFPALKSNAWSMGQPPCSQLHPLFLMCEPPFHLKAQCVSDNESEQVIFKMN